MAFIMNQHEIEDVQVGAAHDYHRPNTQAAVLTLARLMEWTNSNSDGWAYWRKPVNASTRLQTLIRTRYARFDADSVPDIPAKDLKSAYTPIKSFLTRQGVDHSLIFPNG